MADNQYPPPPPDGPPTVDPTSGKPLTRIKKRIWFIIGGAIAAILLIGGGGFAQAEMAASTYEDAVSDWRADELRPFVNTVVQPPTDLYIFEDYLSEESLEEQAAQCVALEETSEVIETTDALDRPSLGFAPLGILSGNYREASSTEDERDKKAKDFQKVASDAYEQLHADCLYQVATSETTSARKNANEALGDAAMKEGETLYSVNYVYTCADADEGCYPPNVGDRYTKYVKAYDGFVSAIQAQVDLAESETCSATSLGEKGCELVAKMYRDEVAAETKWIDTYKSTNGNVSNAKADELEQLDKASRDSFDQGVKEFGPAIAEVLPQLKDNGLFNEEDAWEYFVLSLLADDTFADLSEASPS